MDSPLTRQQAADIVARLFGWNTAALPPAVRYGDHYRIAGPYLRSVYALRQHGIMVGQPDGNFDPEHGVTRAEAAAIISRLPAAGAPAPVPGPPAPLP